MNFAIFLFRVKRHFNVKRLRGILCVYDRVKQKNWGHGTLQLESQANIFINILQPYQWLMGTDFTLESECINSSSS